MPTSTTVRPPLAPLLALALCCALASLSSCSGPRTTAIPEALPDQFPDHSTDEIVDLVRGSTDTLKSFRARANVTVASPEQQSSFGAHIDHRRADSLFLSVRLFLGIEAARALVTPDSFFVYDRIKKKLYYGDIDKAGTLVPIPVSGDDLFAGMLGILGPNRDGEKWTRRNDATSYFLDHPNGLLTVEIDPRIWRVSKMTQRTTNGEVLEERIYSEFDFFHDVMLPRRVEVTRPFEETYASIYYRSVDLNPASLALVLNVGDSVERVAIR